MQHENGEWSNTGDFFSNRAGSGYPIAPEQALSVTHKAALRHGILGQRRQRKSTIRICIIEEPLTPLNLIDVVSAVIELFTKCWLIAKGRNADLMEYTIAHNRCFDKEANLVIAKISYNSPLTIDFKLDASPQSLMFALATGIDAIAQAPQRIKSATLENLTKELMLKLKESEANSVLANQEQARQIAAQKAEQEKQLMQLEIEKKGLELEKMRIDYAFEIAVQMIEMIRPDADQETKAQYYQSLLPSLFKLGNSKGLELALPERQNSQDELTENKDALVDAEA